MAPLVALQVFADEGPGPGRRIECERHVGLRAAPPVSNLIGPTGTHILIRLGHRRRCCGLSLRVIGVRSYPKGYGGRTGDVQAGVVAAIDVVPAATGHAQAMELQSPPR